MFDAIDPKVGSTRLQDLTVYDGIIVLQLIEKMLRTGQVAGREIAHVATLRMKTAAAIRAVSGIDVDSPPKVAPANSEAE